MAAEEEPFRLPASTQPSHIDFSSDHFDYDRSSSSIHLKGHVWMRQSTQTVRSEEVWINLEKKRAKATGYVQMEDGKDLLFGDQGDFDLDSGEGYLTDASAGFAPWRIHSVSAKRNTRRDISFWHAWFTSCNLDPNPHYYFRSTYMKVRPGKWLISFNDLFYLHHVPVFYTPFLWKSLRKKHILRTRLHFGDDKRNGAEIKTFTLFDLSSSVMGKILLDYYDRQGIGYGTEASYKRNKDDHGAIFAYRITERPSGPIFSYRNTDQPSGLTRWTFQGDDYQTLAKGYAFQMRLQAQTDPSFGNDYSRSSYLAITPQLFNSGALVHNASWGTTRVSYSREDDSFVMDNSSQQRYLKVTETLPRLDYNSPALTLWKLPWLNTFSGTAANTYSRGSSFLQRTAGSTWGMTRSFPLGRGMSFVPNVSLGETYINQTSYADAFGSNRNYFDSFTARYTAGGNVRMRTWIGDWDLSHGYARRMVPNMVVPDVLAVDRGIESNATSLADTVLLGRSLWVRTSSSYDYRTFRGYTVGFRDRVGPFTSDANWQPAKIFNLQVRNQYQLNQGAIATLLQADLGEREGKFLGFGFENNLSSASYYVASQEFGWKPSSGTWSVALALHSLLHSTGGIHRLDVYYAFAKELKIKKDFHDFHTELLLRVRPPNVKEIMVTVQLRFDTERPVVENKEAAPWRNWKTEP